jgi:hypothetical protein
VKQPPRVSHRQLTLLESEVSIRLDEKAREEVISVLADLLLEALGGVVGGSAGVQNEPEN